MTVATASSAILMRAALNEIVVPWWLCLLAAPIMLAEMMGALTPMQASRAVAWGVRVRRV